MLKAFPVVLRYFVGLTTVVVFASSPAGGTPTSAREEHRLVKGVQAGSGLPHVPAPRLNVRWPAPTTPPTSGPASSLLVAQRAAAGKAPFSLRVPAPPFPADATWLNTAGPIRLKDLRGKFVLLDFWTYCCINCQHILPTLRRLEEAYPNELVVIGVHSAKFTTEQDAGNIEQAILRHGIEHPVINDAGRRIWNLFGVQAWPTIVLIDPEGFVVAKSGGEFKFDAVDQVLKGALPYYRRNRTLDERPIRFDLLAHRRENTPLAFPGKVLADESSKRLFIADSSHHRIVVTTLDGKLIDVIGSGREGLQDGDYATARFNHLQGMAVRNQTLYVADTENHCIRKVDLDRRLVSTIAGTGEQSRTAPPGRYAGRPTGTALASPWALWIDRDDLYIAMAGTHQIWKMPLNEREIGPYAGNGLEDIVDGPLLPRRPYEKGFASFAQPSGLASDGQWLYVADSEGSSIRAVPLDPSQEVTTVVGTARLPTARLFTFGDRDGQGPDVLLQHPLGVVNVAGRLYLADTYNNKIKQLDPRTRTVTTIAGGGALAAGDGSGGTFDEPAGISYANGKLYVADTNHHRICTIDLAAGFRVATHDIAGLEPPAAGNGEPAAADFAGAEQVKMRPTAVRPTAGQISVRVRIDLPAGYKINSLAPQDILVESPTANGPVDRAKIGKTFRREVPAAEFSFDLPVSGRGTDTLKVSTTYYYCQSGAEGLCKVGSVVWTLPLQISDKAVGTTVELSVEASP